MSNPLRKTAAVIAILFIPASAVVALPGCDRPSTGQQPSAAGGANEPAGDREINQELLAMLTGHGISAKDDGAWVSIEGSAVRVNGSVVSDNPAGCRRADRTTGDAPPPAGRADRRAIRRRHGRRSGMRTSASSSARSTRGWAPSSIPPKTTHSARISSSPAVAGASRWARW
jgi:hypothetical protein